MVSHRSLRVSEQIKKEIAHIIENQLKDPRIGFVTVTSVELSGDLRHAKVFVSVYGNELQKEESLKGLQKAAGFIRREIGQRIKLRYTPEISFKFDDSIEHGAKIAKLLTEVRQEGEKERGDY